MEQHDPLQTNESTHKTTSFFSVLEKLGSIDVSAFIDPINIVIKRIHAIVSQIDFDQITQCLYTFGQQIEALVNPQIDEEELAQRIAAYQAWGSYGWTMPGNAPWQLFDTPPNSQKEANRIVMQYCHKQDIEQVFADLETKKHVRKSDLREAKFCFDHGKYKACTMLLFSMIDARLIRLVGTCGTKKRPIGKKAAINLINHIQKEYDDAHRIFFVLRFENLRTCYECIFKYGDDFRNQVPNINRNFVSHGMRWKAVTKTECIQVLLLYYETMTLLDLLKVRRIPTSDK